MDVGSVVVGFAVGWAVQVVLDVIVYRGAHSYPKALARAQERIDALQAELSARRSPVEGDAPDGRDETIRDLEREIARLRTARLLDPRPDEAQNAAIPGFEPNERNEPNESDERQARDHEAARERVAELERSVAALAEENAAETADAARRQSLLAARLMDVESELASYRLGISPVVPSKPDAVSEAGA